MHIHIYQIIQSGFNYGVVFVIVLILRHSDVISDQIILSNVFILFMLIINNKSLFLRISFIIYGESNFI